MSLLSALVAASIMALTSEITVSSLLQIWFFWGVAAVFGISGLFTMANEKSEAGILFGLIGNWKVSGNSSIFVAVIYLALSILFFWYRSSQSEMSPGADELGLGLRSGRRGW